MKMTKRIVFLGIAFLLVLPLLGAATLAPAEAATPKLKADYAKMYVGKTLKVAVLANDRRVPKRATLSVVLSKAAKKAGVKASVKGKRVILKAGKKAGTFRVHYKVAYKKKGRKVVHKSYITVKVLKRIVKVNQTIRFDGPTTAYASDDVSTNVTFTGLHGTQRVKSALIDGAAACTTDAASGFGVKEVSSSNPTTKVGFVSYSGGKTYRWLVIAEGNTYTNFTFACSDPITILKKNQTSLKLALTGGNGGTVGKDFPWGGTFTVTPGAYHYPTQGKQTISWSLTRYDRMSQANRAVVGCIVVSGGENITRASKDVVQNGETLTGSLPTRFLKKTGFYVWRVVASGNGTLRPITACSGIRTVR